MAPRKKKKEESPKDDLSSIPEIQELVKKGLKDKELVYEKVVNLLPDHISEDNEIMDQVFNILSSKGIRIIDDAESESKLPLDQETLNKIQLYLTSDETVDDPLRLYLRDIGKVSLLTGEQEVSIAKRIEEGEEIQARTVLGSSLAVPYLNMLHERIRNKHIDVTKVFEPTKIFNLTVQDKQKMQYRFNRVIKASLKNFEKQKQLLAQGSKLSSEKSQQTLLDNIYKISEKISHKLVDLRVRTEVIEEIGTEMKYWWAELLRPRPISQKEIRPAMLRGD